MDPQKDRYVHLRKMTNESSNISDQNTANVEPRNDTSTSRSVQNQIDLLDNAQAIIRLEKLLTETLAKVEPWLPQSDQGSNNNRYRSNPNMIRVRPIPRNMEEAHHILAMARNLAARTSAPAGWNPNAPVVGFSTPSPLPNQLRSGSLATLQLERAKQIQKYEREKKKRQQEQLQQMQQLMQKKSKSTTNTNNDIIMKTDDDHLQEQDPKRRDILSHEEQLQLDQARINAAQRNVTFQQLQQPRKPKQDVSMNLSDDSDSDDDDDSD